MPELGKIQGSLTEGGRVVNARNETYGRLKTECRYVRMTSRSRWQKATSIHQGFVGHPLELTGGHHVTAGQHINQEDADHVFLGINPETSSRRASPIVFAFRANVR